MNLSQLRMGLSFILLLAFFQGCETTSIAVKEGFGYAKRDQLVDRVTEARDEQDQAKQQFESALAEFLAVTGANVGDLEERYESLKDEYERCEGEAKDVHSRITSVERVAGALFDEWEDELSQYSNDSLRRSSERQLQDTQRQYERLIGAMKTAEAKMAPVLAAFKDQVLFLKHNLNARAIASLQANVTQIQGDVARLVAEMERSIAEANRFIDEMTRMQESEAGGPTGNVK